MKRGEWEKDPCVLIWYPTVCASVRCHDIHASADVIELSVRLKSPVHVWPKGKNNWRLQRGQDRTGGERRETIGCCLGATGEGYATLRAEFTRMVQHHLPPSLASIPSARFGGREQRKSLPRNLWHFLMSRQARVSQYCGKTQGKGGKEELKASS